MNSLSQGRLFEKVNKSFRDVINSSKLNIIQDTSSKELGSFYEGMTNKEIDNSDDMMTEKMMTLQNDFNSKLEEYKKVYSAYLTMLKHNMNIINSYSNMNVKDEAGNKYFVNKYGYARLYSNEAWSKKHSSCPATAPEDNTVEIFNKLQLGQPLGVGQPCNLEGNIIRYTQDNNELKSWVSPDGLKHGLPTEPTELNVFNKNSGCANKNIVDVVDSTYNSVPSGTNYNTTSKCSTTENEDLWNKIVALNNDLIMIARELHNEAEKMNSANNNVNVNLNKTKNVIIKKAEKLNKQREELLKIQSSHRSLMGKFQDNNINIRSDYYNYLAWTIGAVTLGAVAFYKLTNK